MNITGANLPYFLATHTYTQIVANIPMDYMLVAMPMERVRCKQIG